MTKTLLALALAASTLLSAQASAETLKIGTEGAYPPFNFQDSSGKLGGFDVEIGLALCEKMKVECEVVAQDWDGIIPGLVAKKYDMIIASMFITDERKKQVSFTDPYYLAAMTHAAPKNSGSTRRGARKARRAGISRRWHRPSVFSACRRPSCKPKAPGCTQCSTTGASRPICRW